MNKCFCSERASYHCRPCLVVLCEKHKIIHEKVQQTEHIFVKLGKKFTTQQREKIVENLSSKIRIAIECRNKILEESEKDLARIQSRCMQALDKINKK